MRQRINQWSFEAHAKGWVWKQHDAHAGTAITSPGQFSTLLECINDAKLYGYNPTGDTETTPPLTGGADA